MPPRYSNNPGTGMKVLRVQYPDINTSFWGSAVRRGGTKAEGAGTCSDTISVSGSLWIYWMLQTRVERSSRNEPHWLRSESSTIAWTVLTESKQEINISQLITAKWHCFMWSPPCPRAPSNNNCSLKQSSGAGGGFAYPIFHQLYRHLSLALTFGLGEAFEVGRAWRPTDTSSVGVRIRYFHVINAVMSRYELFMRWRDKFFRLGNRMYRTLHGRFMLWINYTPRVRVHFATEP